MESIGGLAEAHASLAAFQKGLFHFVVDLVFAGCVGVAIMHKSPIHTIPRFLLRTLQLITRTTLSVKKAILKSPLYCINIPLPHRFIRRKDGRQRLGRVPVVNEGGDVAVREQFVGRHIVIVLVVGGVERPG